jgi:hypothetical protein
MVIRSPASVPDVNDADSGRMTRSTPATARTRESAFRAVGASRPSDGGEERVHAGMSELMMAEWIAVVRDSPRRSRPG